ncbi:hypothetical protein NMY22_g401 [Coprinellus aureogranulatus]|nr:hypothetical protein NMY22_g401 [Coprinellus aureogranulatus]
MKTPRTLDARIGGETPQGPPVLPPLQVGDFDHFSHTFSYPPDRSSLSSGQEPEHEAGHDGAASSFSFGAIRTNSYYPTDYESSNGSTIFHSGSARFSFSSAALAAFEPRLGPPQVLPTSQSSGHPASNVRPSLGSSLASAGPPSIMVTPALRERASSGDVREWAETGSNPGSPRVAEASIPDTGSQRGGADQRSSYSSSHNHQPIADDARASGHSLGQVEGDVTNAAQPQAGMLAPEPTEQRATQRPIRQARSFHDLRGGDGQENGPGRRRRSRRQELTFTVAQFKNALVSLCLSGSSISQSLTSHVPLLAHLQSLGDTLTGLFGLWKKNGDSKRERVTTRPPPGDANEEPQEVWVANVFCSPRMVEVRNDGIHLIVKESTVPGHPPETIHLSETGAEVVLLGRYVEGVRRMQFLGLFRVKNGHQYNSVAARLYMIFIIGMRRNTTSKYEEEGEAREEGENGRDRIDQVALLNELRRSLEVDIRRRR